MMNPVWPFLHTPGWYERVAQLLPVHAQFAQLAVAAISLANSMDKQGLVNLKQQVG